MLFPDESLALEMSAESSERINGRAGLLHVYLL